MSVPRAASSSSRWPDGIADVLRAVFVDDGIRVEDRAVAVERMADDVRVRTGGGVEVSADRLLVATGRGEPSCRCHG